MKEKYNHSEKALITYKRQVDNLKIYIQNVLHLDLNLRKYIGLRSWYESKNDLRIEIYFKNQVILVEYNSIEKWKDVLTILENNI